MKFMNKIVKVNLSNGLVKKENISGDILREFLGGRGLNAYFLLKYTNENTKAFDPDNILIFSCGLLTGTNALSSARIHVGAISPLTNLLGSSNAGGFFGAEMRACGIFSLLIIGKAKKPVYLYIQDEEVQIKDATQLWGLNTHETEEKIQQQIGGDNIKFASIGPAGEKLVNISSIIFSSGDAAGRTGLGAVMGSKNLKGIAVRATKKAHTFKTERIKEINKRHLSEMKKCSNYETYSKYGDCTDVKWVDKMGAGSVYNYRDVHFKGVDTADGLSLKDLKTKRKSCFNCPIHCRARIEIDQGRHKGFIGERPAFEAIEALGPRCGNADANESVYFHNMCNQYGMDSIEVGSLIAFAMDLYERGILTKQKTDGLELKWGSPEAMEVLVEKIAFRSGWLGKTLARGIREAADIIGNGAEQYAHHVKGLSMTGMDPRGFKGSALGYAISNRGADFTNVYARLEIFYTPQKAKEVFGTEKAADRLSEEGKPLMVRYTFRVSAVIDALGLCKIPYLSLLNNFDLTISSELIGALVGWNISPEELFQCGERIINAERLFNIRRGMNKSDDILPEKFLKEPIDKGVCKGSVVNLEKMLDEFYSLMKWNSKGIPIKEKVTELGLEEIYTHPEKLSFFD